MTTTTQAIAGAQENGQTERVDKHQWPGSAEGTAAAAHEWAPPEQRRLEQAPQKRGMGPAARPWAEVPAAAAHSWPPRRDACSRPHAALAQLPSAHESSRETMPTDHWVKPQRPNDWRRRPPNSCCDGHSSSAQRRQPLPEATPKGSAAHPPSLCPSPAPAGPHRWWPAAARQRWRRLGRSCLLGAVAPPRMQWAAEAEAHSDLVQPLAAGTGLLKPRREGERRQGAPAGAAGTTLQQSGGLQLPQHSHSCASWRSPLRQPPRKERQPPQTRRRERRRHRCGGTLHGHRKNSPPLPRRRRSQPSP